MLSIFLQTAATGTGGVLLLVGFFSLFMAMPGLIVLLPLITGFNGAVSGYNLMEKKAVFAGMWMAHTFLAFLYSLAGLVFSGFLFPLFFTPELRQTLLICAAFSLISTLSCLRLGRWIAQKVKKKGRSD